MSQRAVMVRTLSVLATAAFLTAGCRGESPDRELRSHPGEFGDVAEPEVDVATMMHAPEADLRRARTALANDPKEGVEPLRLAVRFLKDEAALASGSAQDDLNRAAGMLERSEGVLGAAPLSPDALDPVFLTVHWALAEAHLQRADARMGHHENHLAGLELRGAARHLEYALGYAGRSGDPNAVTAVSGLDQLGEELTDGNVPGQDALTEGMQAASAQLEALRPLTER